MILGEAESKDIAEIECRAVASVARFHAWLFSKARHRNDAYHQRRDHPENSGAHGAVDGADVMTVRLPSLM